jgi:hypothetical protein
MNQHLQVKYFNEPGSDNTEMVNLFLKEICKRVESVTPFYNPVLGMVNYVVIYWC